MFQHHFDALSSTNTKTVGWNVGKQPWDLMGYNDYFMGFIGMLMSSWDIVNGI